MSEVSGSTLRMTITMCFLVWCVSSKVTVYFDLCPCIHSFVSLLSFDFFIVVKTLYRSPISSPKFYICNRVSLTVDRMWCNTRLEIVYPAPLQPVPVE